MAGIALTGLASGLDTESIITQLMSAESQPRVNMTYKQAAEQARSTGLQNIASKLSALKLAATTLRSAGTWGDAQSIESADTTKVAARTIAGAASGGHTIAVTGLARATQSMFDYTPPSADGTITVNGQSVAVAAGATIDDAVAAINGTDSAGVYAVNVGGRLALSSKATGAASAASASGTMLAGASTLAGSDSSFTVDGVPYTRSSNVVADAIAGVELTLKGATAGTEVTVSTPGPDPNAVVQAATSFVSAYNATVDAIRSQTTQTRVTNPASTSDAAQGALFNDTGLNGILSSLRSVVSTPIAGAPSALNQLAQLGITTGASTGSGTLSQDSIAGRLTLDSAALRTALSTNPDGVQKLLGATTGTDGVGQAIEGVLNPLTQAGGTMAGRLASSTAQLKNIADGLTKFDTRLSTKETLLRKQFSDLEVALQKNQDTLARVKSTLGLA